MLSCLKVRRIVFDHDQSNSMRSPRREPEPSRYAIYVGRSDDLAVREGETVAVLRATGRETVTKEKNLDRRAASTSALAVNPSPTPRGHLLRTQRRGPVMLGILAAWQTIPRSVPGQIP